MWSLLGRLHETQKVSHSHALTLDRAVDRSKQSLRIRECWMCSISMLEFGLESSGGPAIPLPARSKHILSYETFAVDTHLRRDVRGLLILLGTLLKSNSL